MEKTGIQEEIAGLAMLVDCDKKNQSLLNQLKYEMSVRKSQKDILLTPKKLIIQTPSEDKSFNLTQKSLQFSTKNQPHPKLTPTKVKQNSQISYHSQIPLQQKPPTLNVSSSYQQETHLSQENILRNQLVVMKKELQDTRKKQNQARNCSRDLEIKSQNLEIELNRVSEKSQKLEIELNRVSEKSQKLEIELNRVSEKSQKLEIELNRVSEKSQKLEIELNRVSEKSQKLEIELNRDKEKSQVLQKNKYELQEQKNFMGKEKDQLTAALMQKSAELSIIRYQNISLKKILQSTDCKPELKLQRNKIQQTTMISFNQLQHIFAAKDIQEVNIRYEQQLVALNEQMTNLHRKLLEEQQDKKLIQMKNNKLQNEISLLKEQQRQLKLQINKNKGRNVLQSPFEAVTQDVAIISLRDRLNRRNKEIDR